MFDVHDHSRRRIIYLNDTIISPVFIRKPPGIFFSRLRLGGSGGGGLVDFCSGGFCVDNIVNCAGVFLPAI
jgi:hypothetical protein